MSLRHSILGPLSFKSMSGYDFTKVIDEIVGHFWTADQPHIHRTLAGLVELDKWLAPPLQSQPTSKPFLATFFFASRKPMDDVGKLLKTRRREVCEQLAALEATKIANAAAENVTEVEHALRMVTLANDIAHARTEIDWPEATEQHLERITS